MGLLWRLSKDISEKGSRNTLKAIQLFVYLNAFDLERKGFWGVRITDNLLICTLGACGLEWLSQKISILMLSVFSLYQILENCPWFFSHSPSLSFIQSIILPLPYLWNPSMWSILTVIINLSHPHIAHPPSPYFIPFSTLSTWFQ